jgi:hypothetical protein
MDEERVREIIREMTFWNGKKEMAIDEIAMVQPGLARVMPEIGARTWKLYYAAEAGNWPNAMYQWKEAKALFELGAFMRPKHEEALEQYLREDWSKLEAAIKAEDFEQFKRAFAEVVDSANAWHDKKDKPYIRWRLPDHPPPDLDLRPRR